MFSCYFLRTVLLGKAFKCYVQCFLVKCFSGVIIRDFKIRGYRRLDAGSPMSGELDRVRSVVVLHYQLRTTTNCSSRIHFEDVFPKSQR